MTYIGLDVRYENEPMHITMAFLGREPITSEFQLNRLASIMDSYNIDLKYTPPMVSTGYMKVGRNFNLSAIQVANQWFIMFRKGLVAEVKTIVDIDDTFVWNPHITLSTIFEETVPGFLIGQKIAYGKLYLHQSGAPDAVAGR